MPMATRRSPAFEHAKRRGGLEIQSPPSSHPEDRSNPARANANPKLVAVNQPFKTSQRGEFGSDQQSPVMADTTLPASGPKAAAGALDLVRAAASVELHGQRRPELARPATGWRISTPSTTFASESTTLCKRP